MYKAQINLFKIYLVRDILFYKKIAENTNVM